MKTSSQNKTKHKIHWMALLLSPPQLPVDLSAVSALASGQASLSLDQRSHQGLSWAEEGRTDDIFLLGFA